MDPAGGEPGAIVKIARIVGAAGAAQHALDHHPVALAQSGEGIIPDDAGVAARGKTALLAPEGIDCETENAAVGALLHRGGDNPFQAEGSGPVRHPPDIIRRHDLLDEGEAQPAGAEKGGQGCKRKEAGGAAADDKGEQE